MNQSRPAVDDEHAGVRIRAAKVEDIDSLMTMIASVTPGLTTLQLSRSQLLERIERSHFAFHRQSESHGGEPHVLVMEELATSRLVGTSTVYGKTGGYEPFYAYRLVTTIHHCPQLNLSGLVRRSLHLQRIYHGPTEIGSLFLLPEFRGRGRGRLLSLARFALLAQRPGRFADRVIAEMRGPCDAQGVSPFWEAVMRPFFIVDFPVADALSTVSKPFIEELMPPFPIPLELLPPSAREVIGRVHTETEPALALLEGEGFTATDMVDIFDGGPVIQCKTADIGAVRRCQKRVVAAIEPVGHGSSVIAATTREGFRAVLANVDSRGSQDEVVISPSCAEQLGVGLAGEVWCLAPKP